ncbi:hypothetical protein CP8484711_0532B, partial [Chlamydia psittaci 84-8471/1]
VHTTVLFMLMRLQRVLYLFCSILLMKRRSSVREILKSSQSANMCVMSVESIPQIKKDLITTRYPMKDLGVAQEWYCIILRNNDLSI